ncbi:MAG: sigma-70 family RNA polymerase sigma factor [Cyclobacteriaceae bacterium]
MTSTSSLDHLYKHLFAKMVGGLVKSVGIKNISIAEDIVQETFLAAHQQWNKAIPDKPQAWLFKVCKNIALKSIKNEETHSSIEKALHIQVEADNQETDPVFEMLLACAHPRFSPKQQVIFALRYSAGFKVDQIANILLSKPESITKVLQRIKLLIKSENLNFLPGPPDEATQKILLNILYLMFSEGYKTSSGKSILNTALCEDALSFIQTIIKSSDLSTPDAKALYALMLFNLSRFEARFTKVGDLIDLEHQNRAHWNSEMIKVASHYLNEARTKHLSKYHIEATMAYLHCTADSFENTDWRKIVSLYQKLHLINESPFIQLNLAIAKFYAGNMSEAFSQLKELGTVTFINNYHLYHVALGKILDRKNESALAIQHYQKAITLTAHQSEKKYIQNLIGKSGYSN